jgi:predicted acyl esterase
MLHYNLLPAHRHLDYNRIKAPGRKGEAMTKKRYDIVYPEPVPEGVRLEKNVYAPMRDGVKIAVDIYLPAKGKGPWPVIFAYSPFQKERFFESAKPVFYCAHGYVCVQAAERGGGLSGGKFTFQGKTAAQDGYDLIEWMAKQPWCSGSVGMMGASGYGVMQWITAPLNPPHLKAMAVLATTDNYRGLCYPGGVLRKPFVLNLISGLMNGSIWPGPVPGKEPPMNVISEILANTEDGPFWWEHGGGWKTISRIKAPVLNIVNVPNRLHAIYHLRSYNDSKAPKKLIVTPWTNENYQPWIFETTAFNQHILRWFDHFLKGIDTGIMDEPEVAVFDSGTGKWRYENEYPLARTQWTKYYLHSLTILSSIPPGKKEKPDVYHNISLNTALMASYGLKVNVSKENEPFYVNYISDPLEKDLKVWGPLSFTLYAATKEEVTSDWSFFVKIGEMVTKGVPHKPVTGQPEVKPEANDAFTPQNVQIWSWGSLKAKFREVNEKRSRPGLPWHSFRNPADLKPNTIYEFQIELQPVFKTFKKGCCIWLKIASDDGLFSTWDSASKYAERPATPLKNKITVYHDAAHPSHLLLPVIPDVPEIAPVKPPLRDALPGAPRFIK